MFPTTRLAPACRFSVRPLALVAPAITLAAVLAAASAPGPAPAQQRVAAGPAATCPTGWKPVPAGVDPALRCLPDHIVATPAPGNRRVGSQPSGCPEGWELVAAEVNPILRCQPGRQHRQGSGLPPRGCPDGWKPVSASVHPALRCLPAHIAATPAPGRRAVGPQPIGCPEGWQSVPADVNPILRCLPSNEAVPMRTGTQDKPVARDESIHASPNQGGQAQTVDSFTADIDPKHGGHDHGGPGQRPNAQAQAFTAPRADLAFAHGLRLGSQAIPWGQTARIPAAAAVSRGGGYCVFRYAYATRNQGAAPSGGTANCIHRDTEAGVLLDSTPLAALNVGNAVNTTGKLQLKPGTWMLYVRSDWPQSVTESDEANNLRRVRVVVKGDCD